MNIKPKTILWSLIISVVCAGVIAALTYIYSNLSYTRLVTIIVLFIALFATVLHSFNSTDYKEKEKDSNCMLLFIKDIAFAALFIFLAIKHFAALETVLDWVLAILFLFGLVFNISDAIKNFRCWRYGKHTSSTEED